MSTHPTALSRIAESSGFTMSDVAFLSGLNESTLSRLWDDPGWLDRITGRSLQAVVSAVPLVGEYLLSFSLTDRRARIAHELETFGVVVDRIAFRRLVEDYRVPEQYLSNALNAAIPILNGDVDRSAAWLVRFWGREQDFALGHLLGTSPGPALLEDSTAVMVAATAMIEQFNSRSTSFHAIVSQANLMHHMARANGNEGADVANSVEALDVTRQTALAFRSTIMGRIIASDDDTDIVDRYARALAHKPLMQAVESWAFPTYTHDVRLTQDFSLPRSVVLQETAREVVREVDDYSDAYLYYLSLTSIPTILARDPSFGGALPALRSHLGARIDRCDNTIARNAASRLLSQLADKSAPTAKGLPYDHSAW